MRPTTWPSRRARKSCTSACWKKGLCRAENSSRWSRSRGGTQFGSPASKRQGSLMKDSRSSLPPTGVTVVAMAALLGDKALLAGDGTELLQGLFYLVFAVGGHATGAQHRLADGHRGIDDRVGVHAVL